MVEYSFTSLKFDYESGWVPRLIAAVWLICCMMSGICFASGLRDPTEPPFMVDTLAPKIQSGLPRLQSILRSPDYQGAMLDGQMVQVDGFDGTWKLLSIGTGFVVVSREENYICILMQLNCIIKKIHLWVKRPYEKNDDETAVMCLPFYQSFWL